MSQKKKATEVFVEISRAHGLPTPTPEFRFDEVRRWRFDWIFPGMIAVEIQGGTWSGGKHGRGSGIEKDHEKLNAAQLRGWIVIQVTPKQVVSGEFVELVKKAIDFRCGQELRWSELTRVSIPMADLPTTRIPAPESELVEF